LLLPQASISSTSQSTKAADRGKTAWMNSPTSGSRPGSRQTNLASRSLSSTIGSSRPGSTSGRFSQEEMLCFKRVPTPSSSCLAKRESYWEPGGSGELRRTLAFDNWNTLPVLKGKFYQHPRLSESINHLSSERARSERKNHQKRQNQIRNQQADPLTDEALTSELLEQIYPSDPRKPLVLWKERDFAGLEIVGGGDVFSFAGSTPTGERRSVYNLAASTPLGRARTTPVSTKHHRLSASNFGSQDGVDTAVAVHAATISASLSPVGSGGNFANSTSMGSTGMSGPKEKEWTAAAQRRDIMLDFRKQMLKNFNTIKEGFDTFDREFPSNREMTKKEWRRVLPKFEFVSTVEDRDIIFEQLDINQNGHVSMMEFHIAIEAAKPVRTMEDLRRRWLASNYPCMAQPINVMDEGQPNRRLTLKEFGESLSRVQVMDHAEHLALFNAIADQTETSRMCKVSIGELASALATVSPAAYLEEIRCKLLKRYNGNAEKAFRDIDQDHSGIVSKGEFKARTVFRIGLTEMEAAKMFETIDFDKSGSISMSEFLCAISMSEPSLFHEDLRKKIRQRFRSIRDAFASAMDDYSNADLHHNPKLDFNRFSLLLKDMELKHEELRTLFDLIDGNRDGSLTIREFVTGVRHFAPSCVLEDLRLHCLQTHEYVFEAFTDIGVDRTAPLDLEQFTKVLEQQEGLTDNVDVEAVFNLLDTKNDGLATFGKLIAALQSGGPGNRHREPSEERDFKVTQEVKAEMMFHHKYIDGLKNQVRQNLNLDMTEVSRCQGSSLDSQQEAGGESPSRSMESSPGGFRQVKRPHNQKKKEGAVVANSPGTTESSGLPCRKQKGPPTPSGGGDKRVQSPEIQDGPAASGGGDGSPQGDGGEEEVWTDQSNIAPRIRVMPEEDLAKYMKGLDKSRIQDHKKIAPDPIAGTQQSWSRLWHVLHKSPDAKDRFDTEKSLRHYYQKASNKVSIDVPLLERSHSRHAIHRSVRAHTNALALNRAQKSAPG